MLRGQELVGVVIRADLLRELEGVEPTPSADDGNVAAELHALEVLRPII